MNKSDLVRNSYRLNGALAKKGYDWWWHSFIGFNKKTGKKKSFFIEYFVINPACGDEKIHFGQGDIPEKPSYVMIKAGAWGENKKQLHGFYPISELKIQSQPLSIEVGKCILSETYLSGSVDVSKEQASKKERMCDSGSMSWNLKLNKEVAFNVGYGANAFFRALNGFAMFWHAEGMKTAYDGNVVFEGEEYIVDSKKACGYADKNWGKDFTSPWVWISSCNLKSLQTGKSLENTVFDIGGGRPVIFGVPLNRKLLLDIYYEGVDYEFNFSKFWTGCKTSFTCKETEDTIIWDIVTENKKAVMKVFCSCSKSDMLLVNYEAPDGSKKHNRLWNGGNGTGKIELYSKKSGNLQLIDIMEFVDAGCEYGEYSEMEKRCNKSND